MSYPLLYICECPVCSHGRVRARVCVRNRKVSCVALCDECEAAWKTPDLNGRLARSETDPVCPDCQESLWGPQTHWATIEEICLLGWYNHMRV